MVPYVRVCALFCRLRFLALQRFSASGSLLTLPTDWGSASTEALPFFFYGSSPLTGMRG